MGKGDSSGNSTTVSEIPAELKGIALKSANSIGQLQDDLPAGEFTNRNPVRIAPLSGTQQQASNAMSRNLTNAYDTPLDQSAYVQAGNNLAKNNLFYTDSSGGLEKGGVIEAGKRWATDNPMDQSDIVQAGNRYFDTSIAPGIQNSATLSGLGRSTAAEAARSAAEASTMLPLLQGEQARRDTLLSGEQGRRDTLFRDEQQRGQSALNAEQQRRDAMIDQGLRVGDAERAVTQSEYNADQSDFIRRQALAEQALFGGLGAAPSTQGQTTTSNNKGGK